MNRPRILTLTAIVAVLFLSIATAAAAPKENRGNGNRGADPVGTCVVDGTMVYATGLPTNELLNFWITEVDGSTHGWVLGQTYVGSWSVEVPERDALTKYEFISKQWGKDGKRYDVYAACYGEAPAT